VTRFLGTVTSWTREAPRTPRSVPLPCLLGLVALLGCSSGDSPPSGEDAWGLEEFLRIGSLDEKETSFTSVADIGVTEAALYVLERQPPRVVRFTREGRWVRTFGRRGQGPGEFVGPSRLGITGDTLWVSDPQGGRMELFSTGGEFLKSVRFRILPDSLSSRVVPLGLVPGGGVLAGPGGISIGGVLSGTIDHGTYLRADSVGTILDKIVEVPISKSDFFQARMGEGGIIGGHPLPEGPAAAVFPDGTGVVVVDRWAAEIPDSASFVVKAWGSDATSIFETRISYRPLPIPDGWIRRFLEDEMTRAGEPPPEEVQNRYVELYEGALDGRDYLPPVTGVLAGDDGSVWIRREKAMADSVTWEVISGAGNHLGHLITPAGLGFRASTLDTVWAVETDEFDVPYVVGFRVVR